MREGKGLLLYAIMANPALPREALSGVSGQPLHFVRVAEGGLWAAVSTLADPASLHPPQTADALAYHRVLQALHQVAAILPLRYGTVLDDADQVRKLLVDKHQEYEDLLARVADCHEFGIHAQLATPASTIPAAPAKSEPSAPPSSPGPQGAAYLRARKQHYQREDAETNAAEALVGRLAATLEPWTRERQAQYGPSPSARLSGQILSMSFLVPRGQEQPFRRAFAGLQSAEPQQLQLLGPWPPYSFLSARAS